MIAAGIKKGILQLLLAGSVLGGLYLYMSHTTTALKEAEKQVDEVKADRERLEGEVKDLKEQSKIDKKTTTDHNKVQTVLEVTQAVAIEKVQHEVERVLQEAPVESRGSPQVVDAVSAAVIDGMWDSYDHSVRGETPSPTE